MNIDFKGPLPSATQNKYFLTIIDENSRFPFVFPCPNISSQTVIKCLNQLFSSCGTPGYIYSDRGSSFIPREIKEYLSQKGIATSRPAPYHPTGNAQCERYNEIVWKSVRLALKTHSFPDSHCEMVLPDALHSIRSLLSTSINTTPHERFFGFQRQSSCGTSLPSWLSAPGPVMLRRCKDPLESLTRLNMCISDIRVWMIKNKLKINDSKTEFIIFRSPLLKQNLSDLSVSVGDMQVSPSSKVRDLGVVFDQYLTFHDHISGICKSTHFHLRGIGRIRNLLTFDATAQLIHALITSRLDFCNSILYNLPNKQIERLQRIQNQAARMLKRIPRRNHITPVLRELHWLRIHDRIIFKILLLTHKAVIYVI